MPSVASPVSSAVPAAASRRAWGLLLTLLALAALALLAGVSIGSTGWEWPWAALVPAGQPNAAAGDAAVQDAVNGGADALRLIVWEIRLPRTLGAWLAGGLLGVAGAVAQGLFRNPLADPYLLGSSSGASLGVALALVALGGSPFAAELLVRVGITGAAPPPPTSRPGATELSVLRSGSRAAARSR